MKRFFKTLVNFVATIMLVVACLSFAGCGEDITTVSLNLNLYDYSDGEYYQAEDVEMSIDFYGHLAPKTVDKMLSYLKDGYYDGALLYRIEGYKQIMMGDLVLSGGATEIVTGEDGSTNIVQNDIKPQLDGEFEAGGTVGSDLVNSKGYVGLWRTWKKVGSNNSGNNKFNVSGGLNTGRATWYMPTATDSTYNGFFCVFGVMDMDDESTTEAFAAIEDIFAAQKNYTQYVIYFTGEYDENKVDQNHGLTYHCVTKEYFDSLSSDEVEELGIFEAKIGQLECYNQYTIQVANNANGSCGAMIKSAKIA